MGTFKKRLPSKRDAFLLFAACVFPVHVWSILNVLREVPAWVLRLSVWELAGVIAYTQVLALVESLTVSLALLVLSVVLPAGLFRNRLVAQGSMLVLVTSCWAIVAHYNDDVIRLWGARDFLLWLVFYVVSITIFYILIYRSAKIERAIRSVVERLAVLSGLYVALDLLCILIVVLRNLQGALE